MASVLNIATRALNTNLSTLQVIGNNIANVNTAGYSRQTANLASAGYQQLGSQYYGMGVQIDSVTRAHDVYLTREAQLTASLAAADSTRLARLQQLENLFPVGEDGLGASVNELLNAWTDVASSPTNQAARVVVLGRGEELASRLRETATQIDLLARTTSQQVTDTVTQVNRLSEDIAKINQKIIEAQGSKSSPNDLLDQRDKLVAELSQLMQVSTVAADDGTLSVFAGGSQPLVLGTKASSLAVERDTTDPSQINVVFKQSGYAMTLAPSSLGGELGGLMTFMTQDLASAQNQLGRMALVLSSTVNAQHQLGVDLQGNAGGDFFVAAAPAQGLAAAGNTGNAQIAASVADATQLQASNYEMRFDASGVTLVRLSDGTSQSFGSLPATFDGLQFEAASGSGAVGDVFLIKPYADVARNMQMAVSAADRLAAGSPVIITPASGNTGGASIENLYAVSDSANLTDPVTITFQADGSFTVTGLGPDNPAPDNPGPPASYNYTPGQPMQFNGWSLTLRGTPSAGDSFSVTATPAGGGQQNAGNANGMLALRDLTTYDGVSLSNGYGTLISDLGTRVQGAQFAATYSSSIAASAETARQSVSGVNLDEEAARLLQYQQAYQASAKLLQMAQSMFDTILQTVR
ncbi:flagellar hook-associated protein FlgK [Hydrogenophaga sp. NFH-34]|uniref:flagellar hook-associated protein FlgK n=1 Tax=Hydrogenophaga sp. NFH-34 TaxID=2744446 RepID=UPI001F2FE39E|nr:flagellar hook-associated protein FlgK [Hydrogenophaga sp. NFH-34]